ncbi:MAG TPA: DNA polymerase III subunit gamma/tau [Nevskiaceae bacterium]
MSYLALARRYRPRQFDEVLGQEPVVRALRHALDQDRLHPALLLTGTRGVGKTTLGRIIAKCLNCEKGVSSTPCGECDACREVDEGRFIDLIEIDAASRTKVDDTRQLLENVAYAPARGRYKVYLIDEVHMLSTASFNALLKTLEEPPAHVKFILATTDPQKLPVTVLSRCLRFNLRRLPVEVIREALARVAEREATAAGPGAFAVLARAADGSMRDGLSLLDQAIAWSGGEPLERAGLEQMLGTVGERGLLDVLAAIHAGEGAAVVTHLDSLAEQVPDYAALLDTLAADLQRIAVLQVLPSAESPEDDVALRDLVPQIPAEDVQLYYEIAVHARRDLRWAPDPRIGFEMAVIRMYAFRPVGGRVPKSPSRASGTASGGSTAAIAAPSPPAAPDRAASTRVAAAELPAEGTSAEQETPIPASTEPASWRATVETLGLAGLDRELARHCVANAANGGALRLVVEPSYAHLINAERQGRLEQALRDAGALEGALEIVAGGDEALETPARVEARESARRQADAEARLATSATAEALREAFDATLQPGSVRPVE